MTAPRRDAGRIYFVLCFMAFAAVILLSAQPPLLRDYPDWVYQGVLLAKSLSGHPVAGYALKRYPVPNSITTVGIALLTLAFGWLWAAKLWIVICLGLGMATVFHVARAFSFARWLWWVLPTLLFFGQTFWFATISFSIGSYALWLLIAMLYRRDEKPALVASLLVLCFFLHLIVYAAAGLLVLIYCIEHRRWRLTYIGLATLPLPLWYFAGRRLTPSNEMALGYSPVSHLAAPVLVACLFLMVLCWRPRWLTPHKLGVILGGAALLLLLAALLSTLVPEAFLRDRLQSSLFILRLKVVKPLELFGFVNVIYEPMAKPLRSATLTLLHGPLFRTLVVLDVVAGAAILIAIARAMLSRARGVAGDVEASPDTFLWRFIALFCLLYIASPPNAMGVISIDVRLAQLALGPALFLVARQGAANAGWFRPGLLRGIGVAAVVLLAVSLYQLAVSQHRVRIETTATTSLPPPLPDFAAVDPTAISEEYDRLRANRLEGFIFATGLFYQTIPWQPVVGVGR